MNLNSGIAIEIGAPMIDFTAIGSARMAGGYNAINCESHHVHLSSLCAKQTRGISVLDDNEAVCTSMRSRLFGDDRDAHHRVRRYRDTAFQKIWNSE